MSLDERVDEGRGRAGEKRVVLLVDDERPVLSALERLLRGEPYEIVSTSSALEALESVGNRRIDVVLTDQRMPLMNGTELVRAVRERSPGTRCAILTAFPETSQLVDGMNLRLDRFLTKPWDGDELLDAIRDLVGSAPEKKERDPQGRPARVVAVDCADQTVQTVTAQLLPVLATARWSGEEVRLRIENLGLLDGPVAECLLSLLRLAAKFKVRIVLLEGSGFASSLLQALGGWEPYVRVDSGSA